MGRPAAFPRAQLAVGFRQGATRLADPGPNGVRIHVVAPRQLHRRDLPLHAFGDDACTLFHGQAFRYVPPGESGRKIGFFQR
jgi:hypothetical protein